MKRQSTNYKFDKGSNIKSDLSAIHKKANILNCQAEDPVGVADSKNWDETLKDLLHELKFFKIYLR